MHDERLCDPGPNPGGYGNDGTVTVTNNPRPMRTCACCGETKLVSAFSWTGGHNNKPVSHCKECGVWLRLLRQVFGPTRDWQKNRERTRERDRIRRLFRKLPERQHNDTLPPLYEAWGVRKTK